MKLLAHFLTLVRVRNLFFIALTQLLFYFCIARPQLANHPGAVSTLGLSELAILMLASVLIAAGGYVINDYFDRDIDSVNRPQTAVLGTRIGRRWGIFWHLALSLSGMSLSLLLTLRTGNWLVFLFNSLAVLLLWVYSTSFKKEALIGNIVISLLTAWVVLVVYVSEVGLNLTRLRDAQRGYIMAIYRIGILYGAFAFMASVIREVVKDLEDMPGDARYGCRTMPIVWGVRASKVFVSVWMIVLFFALFALAVYSIMLQWWMFAGFIAFAVMWPLGRAFKLLLDSSATEDYTRLSRLVKWVMFNGILSMLFFMIYE
jgi:4-hydroxybenzoate polyprenyltransferase